ncbi:MAG TPA: Asp-tRNA(Asn)/Glu-tRNA(Gln) amidotransferase subunit GatC [Firmicutes bacterium]|nr:Asp-tRNA(Asn)/Glu-tRNA(Gln) amidotransferase subunit GatC [Bacillota bacterium]
MEIDVKRIAHLARIDLDPQDENTLATELELILARINKLLEVDVEGVPPTFALGTQMMEPADDVPHESLCRELVMECAPSVHEGYFKVPRESQGV